MENTKMENTKDVFYDSRSNTDYKLIFDQYPEEDVSSLSNKRVFSEESEEEYVEEAISDQESGLNEDLKKISDKKMFLKGVGEGLWEVVGPGVKLNLITAFSSMAELFKAALVTIRNIVRGSNNVHLKVSDSVVRQTSLQKLQDKVVDDILKTPVKIKSTNSLKLVSDSDIRRAEEGILSVKARVLNILQSPVGKVVKTILCLAMLATIPAVLLLTPWGAALITMAKTALVVISAFVLWNSFKESVHMVMSDDKLDYRKLGRLSVLAVAGLVLGSVVPLPGFAETLYGKSHIMTHIMDFSLFGVVVACCGSKGLSKVFELSTSVGKRIIGVIQEVMLLISDKKSSLIYRLNKMEAPYLIPDIFFGELYTPFSETNIGQLTNALVLGPGAKPGDVSPAQMMYSAVKTQVEKQISSDMVNVVDVGP